MARSCRVTPEELCLEPAGLTPTSLLNKACGAEMGEMWCHESPRAGIRGHRSGPRIKAKDSEHQPSLVQSPGAMLLNELLNLSLTSTFLKQGLKEFECHSEFLYYNK